MKKKHICILSAGTANGYALIQQLRKKYSDQVKIYSADIGHAQWIASANLADEHLIVPRVDSNQYQANMNSIFQKNLIDWVVPLIDDDCIHFPKSDISPNNFKSFSIPKEGIDLFRSKSRQREFLQQENIECEKQLSSCANDNWFYKDDKIYLKSKIVVKKFSGSGSKNVRVLDSKSVQKLILDPDEFVTEFIDSEEYTTDVFHLNDQIQTCSRIRREVKQGVCTKAEVFWNETLHEVAVELVKKFKMPTCFNFQTRLKDGNHAIIDLNPRIGAGSTASRALGFDYFDACCKVLVGLEEEIKFFIPQKNYRLSVVRAYHDYINPL